MCEQPFGLAGSARMSTFLFSILLSIDRNRQSLSGWREGVSASGGRYKTALVIWQSPKSSVRGTSGPLSRRFSLHAANERKEFFLLANRERKYSLSFSFLFRNFTIILFVCYCVGWAVVVLFERHRRTCRVECKVWPRCRSFWLRCATSLTRVDHLDTRET